MGKQTGVEPGKADVGGDDKLVGRTRKVILGVVLLAIFLPLDLATTTILSIGGLYILAGPFRQVFG